MKTDIITIDDLLDKAEELGWFINESDIGWEFNQGSPAGEDFGFYVSARDVHSADDMVREIRSYANDFDIEEHIEMWIEARGRVTGIPDIKILVKDADDIKLMLKRLASALEDALEGRLEDEDSPETTNEENARIFCGAIKALASKPENLDNLCSYLSSHFDEWLSKYGSSPENISCELREFANMEI